MISSNINRLETVLFSKDAGMLLERLSAGGLLGARIFQEGNTVVQIPGHWTGGGTGDLEIWLRTAGVDVDSVFDVDLVMSPTAGGLFCQADGSGPANLRNRYPGGTVFLILNGPSFNKEARDLLANRPGVVTFCVNNGAHGFRPDLWTCVDAPERFTPSIWQDGRVKKFVPVEFLDSAYMEGGERVADCPNVLGYARNERFCAETFLTEETINWGNHKNHGGGRSVMLVALRIAYELGFRRVYLVGCDFEMTADQRYWFAEQRTKGAIRNNMNSYEILTGFFKDLLPEFEEAGLEVRNCNAESKLRVFLFEDLESAVIHAVLDADDSATDGMYR